MANLSQNGVKILNSTIRANNNNAVFRSYLPKNYAYNVFSGDSVYMGGDDGLVHSFGEDYVTFYGDQTRSNAGAYVATPLYGVAQKFWINTKGAINSLTLSSQNMYLASEHATNDYIGVDICIDPTALYQFKVKLEGLTDGEKETEFFDNIGIMKFSPAFELNEAGDNIVGSTTNGGGSSCYFTTKKYGAESAYLTAHSDANAALGNSSYEKMGFSFVSFSDSNNFDDSVYVEPNKTAEELSVVVCVNNSKF